MCFTPNLELKIYYLVTLIVHSVRNSKHCECWWHWSVDVCVSCENMVCYQRLDIYCYLNIFIYAA